MKFYICRRGKPDFVCQAPTVADAIEKLWYVTQELPKASYRIHQGMRRQSKVVSSAVAFWRLNAGMQEALVDVLKVSTSEDRFVEFCQNVVRIWKEKNG